MTNTDNIERLLLRVQIDNELAAMPSRTHGTSSCYNRGKCRGPLCKEANRQARSLSRGKSGKPAKEGSAYAYLLERLQQHHEERADVLAYHRGA